jgi:hypothetical protein
MHGTVDRPPAVRKAYLIFRRTSRSRNACDNVRTINVPDLVDRYLKVSFAVLFRKPEDSVGMDTRKIAANNRNALNFDCAFVGATGRRKSWAEGCYKLSLESRKIRLGLRNFRFGLRCVASGSATDVHEADRHACKQM